MFQITPFNREIQNIKLSPPLISQPTADSFPPREAKGYNPLACTLSYKAYTLNRVLSKNRGYGRLLAAPTGRIRSSGYLRKPGLRAAISRPYRAYAFNRVLAKIRDYGRILSAPTERVLFILLYVLKSNLSY